MPRTLRFEALERREMLTTFTVANTADSGAGSLRDAIEGANAAGGADKIVFQSNLSGKTIKLESSLPAIEDDLTIQAPGKGTPKITISGQGIADVRPFSIDGVTATFKNLIVARGNAVTAGGDDVAGGIFNSGDLTLKNCVVRNNFAANLGGGIFNGGELTLNNVEVSGNRADNDGGGIVNQAASTLVVNNSRIVGNRAGSGAGDEAGGIFNFGNATISRSTIAGNLAATQGGGLKNADAASTLVLRESAVYGNRANEGGGLAIVDGDVTILNSTLAYNSADGGGGGGGVFLAAASGTLTIVNCTIAHNSDTSNAAQGAGGVAKISGTLVMSNNIVSLNGAGPASVNDNIESADINTSGGNVVGGDPLLGPLQNNGGSTFSMAPLEGSPVIDDANDLVATENGLAGGTPLFTDQLGNERIFDGDGNGGEKVDFGAVEAASVPPTLQAMTAKQDDGIARQAAAAPRPANSLELAFATDASETRARKRAPRAADAVFALWGVAE